LSPLPCDAVRQRESSSGRHLAGRLRYQAGPSRRSFASLGLGLTGQGYKTLFSQTGLVNLTTFRWPRNSRSIDSGGLHGISSPGMRSSTENVDFGDASVGVARNPLRDGAPPTGLALWLLSVRSASPRQSERPRSLFARLHRSSCQRWSTWVTAGDGSLPPAGWPMRSGHRLRHSSKSCNLHVKDDCFERDGFLLARRRCEMPVPAFPRVLAAGLVLPLSEPDCVRTIGVEKISDFTVYPSVRT